MPVAVKRRKTSSENKRRVVQRKGTASKFNVQRQEQQFQAQEKKIQELNSDVTALKIRCDHLEQWKKAADADIKKLKELNADLDKRLKGTLSTTDVTGRLAHFENRLARIEMQQGKILVIQTFYSKMSHERKSICRLI